MRMLTAACVHGQRALTIEAGDIARARSRTPRPQPGGNRSVDRVIGPRHLGGEVVMRSNSISLLADTIHNFGDAATAIPLAIAFAFAKREPGPRFTYGYGRIEDFAGIVVVLTILAAITPAPTDGRASPCYSARSACGSGFLSPIRSSACSSPRPFW